MIEMENTGERIYPSAVSEAFKDHRNRYYLALDYIKPGDTILDVACGVGYGTYFMAVNSPCKLVYGVDRSENALGWAKQYFSRENIIYNKVDLEEQFEPQLPKKKFDLITCFETIEHIQNDLDFLKGLFKLLKPNKTLLISAPNEEVVPHENNPFFDNGKNPYHYRHYKSAEFQELLDKAGFFITGFYTQNEEIVKGQGLAVNILACTNIPRDKPSLDDFDQIIRACYEFRQNSAIPDYCAVGLRFYELISMYKILGEASGKISCGEFREAIALLETVDESLCPEAVFLKGLAYEGKGDLITSARFFLETMNISPRLIPSFEKLARQKLQLFFKEI